MIIPKWKHEDGIVVIQVSKEEVERARLISEEKYELDTQTRLTVARQEGIKEGRQEGIEEGRQEERQDVINLLKSGKSLEEIIAAYGKASL